MYLSSLFIPFCQVISFCHILNYLVGITVGVVVALYLNVGLNLSAHSVLFVTLNWLCNGIKKVCGFSNEDLSIEMYKQ